MRFDCRPHATSSIVIADCEMSGSVTLGRLSSSRLDSSMPLRVVAASRRESQSSALTPPGYVSRSSAGLIPVSSEQIRSLTKPRTLERVMREGPFESVSPKLLRNRNSSKYLQLRPVSCTASLLQARPSPLSKHLVHGIVLEHLTLRLAHSAIAIQISVLLCTVHVMLRESGLTAARASWTLGNS